VSRQITAFLGPVGTFSHRAVLELAPDDLPPEPFDTAEEIVDAVESGEVAAGVIALENSLEGPVTANLDVLLHDTRQVLIAGERILPVSFSAYKRTGDDTRPKLVRSHAVGLAQCLRWIRRQGVLTESSASTMGAVKDLAEHGEPGTIAIGPAGSGEPLGLQLIEAQLESHPASTRFVLLHSRCPGPTGMDRTAFAVAPERDEPGSLLRVLTEFSLRGINLAVIVSRPTRGEIGRYVFYLECEGHLTDPVVRKATAALMRAHNSVRVLGTFPADRVARLAEAAAAGPGEPDPPSLEAVLNRVDL
jgi:prephenate dehydratase